MLFETVVCVPEDNMDNSVAVGAAVNMNNQKLWVGQLNVAVCDDYTRMQV